MRKNIFKKLLIYTFAISVLSTVFTYPARAEIDPKLDYNALDLFPKILCELLNTDDCDTSGQAPIPDPNQPTPPYPTGEPYPTSNPQITPPSGKCMPTYGPITCGPRSLPLPLNSIRACGHCGKNYGSPLPGYCKPIDNMYIGPNAGGNAEAIDIGLRPLTSVPLPFIHGSSVIWYHKIDAFFADGSDPYAAFQEYVGTIPQDKKRNIEGQLYYVRYLHTQKGSGSPIGSSIPSGNEGAKVAAFWTRGGLKVPGNHIHMQIFDGKIERWVDATNFYCY